MYNPLFLMKQNFVAGYVIFIAAVLAMSVLKPENVFAQVCWPSRYMEQYACESTCTTREDCCENGGYNACSGNPDLPCSQCDLYPNAGICAWYCDSWLTSSTGQCINTGSFLGSCSSASEGCTWGGMLSTCIPLR